MSFLILNCSIMISFMSRSDLSILARFYYYNRLEKRPLLKQAILHSRHSIYYNLYNNFYYSGKISSVYPTFSLSEVKLFNNMSPYLFLLLPTLLSATYKLEYVSEISRHGARTPVYDAIDPFNTDWGVLEAGDLTPVGMR